MSSCCCSLVPYRGCRRPSVGSKAEALPACGLPNSGHHVLTSMTFNDSCVWRGEEGLKAPRVAEEDKVIMLEGLFFGGGGASPMTFWSEGLFRFWGGAWLRRLRARFFRKTGNRPSEWKRDGASHVLFLEPGGGGGVGGGICARAPMFSYEPS